MLRKKKNAESQNSEMIDRYVSSLGKKERKRTKRFKPRNKRMYKKRKLPIFICSFLILVFVFLGAAFLLEYNMIYDINSLFKKEQSINVVPQSTGREKIEYSMPNRPTKIFATTVKLGKDFTGDSTPEELGELVEKIKERDLTTVFVSLSPETFFEKESLEKKAFETFTSFAAAKGLTVFAEFDLSAISDFELKNPDFSLEILNKVEAISKTESLGGIFFSGIGRNKKGADFNEYLTLGSFMGYKKYSETVLTNFVSEIRETVKKANPTLYLGLVCDSVYESKEKSENGMDATGEPELLKDKNADVLLWLREKYFDGVFVDAAFSTVDKSPSFNDVINWWSQNIPADSDIGFRLSSDLAVKGEAGFKNPDQLTRQLMALNDKNRYTFCFNSFYDMENDKTEASKVAYKYISGGVNDDYILTNLTITSPKNKNVTVYEDEISFVGASDPNFKLTFNGKEMERTEYGYFSVTEKLKVGNNYFTFEHKGSKETYTVNYVYVVLKSYSPKANVTMESGSTLIVKAVARNGSNVTASLGGKVITLEKTAEEKDTNFATYVGGFKLKEYTKDTNLGSIVFVGTHSGVTDKYSGGKVTVKKKPVPVTSTFIPEHEYISVGNTLIAKVVKRQIETFSGNTFDDLSQPFNNYLPEGTVDYCSEETSVDPESGNVYRTLRYGKRVYSKREKGNIEILRGTLPSFNTLEATSLTTDGQYTVLTLKSLWHAPFVLEVGPQSYKGGTSDQRGLITSRTFKYVDIKFCYAKSFDGNLDAFKNSPVFSKAELHKGTADYTLRLHLRKKGNFYGFSADYDKDSNLVFKFLNPAKAQSSNNKYGGTLKGITIVIDAGHGGSDPGALGSNPNFSEANRNLALAKVLEAKLKSIGAKVVMTRTSNTALTQDERMNIVRNASANLAISVHRDASTRSSVRGFTSYYFNPYTEQAASYIQKNMAESKNYTSSSLKWHYFYMSRISDCPVVLTENGFMSNASDFNNMLNGKWNESCADAIVKGIVEYFLNIG